MTKLVIGYLAVLALLGVAGCVPTVNYVYPISVVAPGEPPTEDIKTATDGEVLYSQSLAHAGAVLLENTVTSADNVGNGLVTWHFEMPSGLRLYPALRTAEGGRHALCSAETVAYATGGLTNENTPRQSICFVLANETIRRAPADAPHPVNATPIGGALWLADDAEATTGFLHFSGGAYARGVEAFPFSLEAPARFRVASADDGDAEASALQVGISYKVLKTGFGQLQAVYITGEQQLALRDAPVAISTSDAFPRVVTIRGASIEVLALQDGVLAYRVRQGFPSDRWAITDLTE